MQRSSNYREQNNRNKFFEEYLIKSGISVPQGYSYANANNAAELPSVRKYAKFQPMPDKDANKVSLSWMYRHFQNYMFGSSKLDYRTVRSNIDMNTSPGYPWSLKYPTKQEMEMNIRIEEVINEYEKDLRSGQESKWLPVWTSSVKAEMRPDQKVRENKLRTFCASPIEHSIMLNKYCLHMNNRFYDAGVEGKVWSKVGVSKYNRGFHRIAMKLRKHPNGFNLDMKEWDSSEFASWLRDIADFRLDCLRGSSTFEEGDEEVVHKLYASIIDTLMILTNGDTVMKETGMPSGSSNTVVDNTLNLYRLLAYTFIRAMQESPENIQEKMYTYTYFTNNVEAALYGDDNTLTISDELLPYFNAKVIALYAKELNMTVTAEDDIWEPQPVDKLCFLSHNFRLLDNGYYVPVPETKKVLCSLMYGSKRPDPRWHLLRAMALRMECFYNDEAFKIIEGYIDYIMIQHKEVLHDMECDKMLDGIKIQQILNMRHPKQDLEMLYLNLENVCSHKGSHNTTHLPLKLELDCGDFPNQRILQSLKMSEAKAVVNEVKKEIKKEVRKRGMMKGRGRGRRIGKKTINKIKRMVGAKHLSIRGRNRRGRITGRGDYITDLADKVMRPFNDNTASVGVFNKAARGLGRTVGNYFAPGSGAGEYLGNAASWMSRLFGFGDYEVKQNSLCSGFMQGSQDCIISGDELMFDVMATSEFTNNAYVINPGNSVLFPWLSTIAQNYEQYEFLGLIFYYKPTSSMAIAQSNTGMGTVNLATDYDVLDSPYTNINQMMVTTFASSFPPYQEKPHPIECDPKQNVMRKLFVQPGNSVSTYPDDPRFSALGLFQVATQNIVGSGAIGQMWVTYHVKFSKPQIPNSATPGCAHIGVNTNTLGQISAFGVTQSPDTFTVTNPSTGNVRLRIQPSNDTFQTGSFHIGVTGIGSIQNVNWSYQAATIFTAGGNASFLTRFYGPGIPNEYSQVATLPTADNEWMTNTTYFSGGNYERYAASTVVTLTSNNDYVDIVFPWISTGGTCYFDVFVTPYVTTVNSKHKKQNNFDNLDRLTQQMESVIKINTELQQHVKLLEEKSSKEPVDKEEKVQSVKVDVGDDKPEKVINLHLPIHTTDYSTLSRLEKEKIARVEREEVSSFFEHLPEDYDELSLEEAVEAYQASLEMSEWETLDSVVKEKLTIVSGGLFKKLQTYFTT